MLPNFLIIGAQKSGTTFVHECLREHPDIFMPRSEVRFFEDPDYHESGFQQFEALFAKVRHQKAIGIKRADYLAKPECPARIHEYIPSARLIVTLRSPVQRAISAYFWYMRMGYIPLARPEEGMRAILDASYTRSYPKSQDIIDYGFYGQQLQRYLRYFDREQMLILLLTRLRADPLESIRGLYRFLEVDQHYLPRARGRTWKSAIYSPSRIRFRRLFNPLIYSYCFENGRVTNLCSRGNVVSTLLGYAIGGTDRLLLARLCRNDKPSLSVPLRKRLLDVYREDVARLEHLLGTDLSGWRR